jgi:Lectin C-type domain
MRSLILLVAAFLCFATGAQAQPVYGKPLYDPSSKSYFELVRVTREQSPGSDSPALPWDKAVHAASGRMFKGTPGRLAIIRSQDTHMFILQNLRPSESAWIGLRYLCKTRELRWVNGQAWQKGQFASWHEKWDHSGVAGCVRGGGETDWMPVAYTPAGQGFRWFAIGGKKIYVSYLVEYPTGKE